MRIEYVIIESKGKKQNKPSKSRVRTLIKKSFNMLDNNTIGIVGKRKVFELSCDISCQTATDEKSEDSIYNLVVASNHRDKSKQAELLEQFHRGFQKTIDDNKVYYLIVAYDGVSEYYCNKIYPKYQKFERQLRHLIFKVVTKAYGALWTKVTLDKDLKKKIKEEVKSRSGYQREDILIEQALYEMSLGQLIDYLFYSDEDIDIQFLLDDKYPSKHLSKLSKEEILTILEKARRHSVWNIFLADEINISEPITKLTYLKKERNNVAHCKFFYFKEYKISIEYLDLFIPEIEYVIKNNAIINDSSLTDVLISFGKFTKSISDAFTVNVAPALKKLAESMTIIMESVAKPTNKIVKGIVDNVMINQEKELQKTFLALPKIATPKYNYPPMILPKIEGVPEIDEIIKKNKK